jgi:hypothetical protein
MHISSKSRLSKVIIAALIAIIVGSGAVTGYLGLSAHHSSPSPTPTPSPKITPSFLPTPLPTPTSTAPNTTPKPTANPTSSPQATQIPTPTPTQTAVPTALPTSSPSPTPSPTPTPTPTQTPAPAFNHTVDWTTMANYQTDAWNISITNPYTITLNDSMTLSSGEQWLTITAYNGAATIWSIQFINSTYVRYANANDYGFLNCSNGIVQVTVNDTAITYTGTNSYTSSPNGIFFPEVTQIQTFNGDGVFNGGILGITVS